MKIRIGFSGARPPVPNKWIGYDAIFKRMLEVADEIVSELPSDVVVVHGGALGLDKEVDLIAKLRGLEIEEVLPNYAKYGRAAPIIRNAYVTTCQLVHAFPAPWSKGTWDAMQKTVDARIILLNHHDRYWPEPDICPLHGYKGVCS